MPGLGADGDGVCAAGESACACVVMSGSSDTPIADLQTRVPDAGSFGCLVSQVKSADREHLQHITQR